MANPNAIAKIIEAVKKMPNATFRELLSAGLITKRDIVLTYDTPIDWSK